MKKHIINFIIIIICTGLTNIFTRFLIVTFLESDIKIVSIRDIVMCAICPLILLFFEKDMKKGKLVIISLLYSFFYSLLSIYM